MKGTYYPTNLRNAAPIFRRVRKSLLGQATELQKSQPEISLLLNVEALRRASATIKEEARFALLAKLTRPYHNSTPLTGHSDWVSDVDFSPDGDLLASTSGITVRLWDSEVEALVSEACEIANRDLSRDEGAGLSDQNSAMCTPAQVSQLARALHKSERRAWHGCDIRVACLELL